MGFDVESLRYRGSGWLVDRALPHSPIGVLAVAGAMPLLWLALGYAVTPDAEAFFATPDVVHQLWFLPLHVLSLRLVGTLWAEHLDPALDGLALHPAARRRIRRGAYGPVASAGALLVVLYFIYRDTSYGLTSGANGLIPFDDPDLWGFAALGRTVHFMMLGLWIFEWLFYGYLLWLQVWILAAWVPAVLRTDFAPELDRVLGGGGYKKAFQLFGRTTSVCLVFALGNLLFIYKTGELFPREAVEIDSVSDFLREMSDLTSVAVLFAFALVAIVGFARALRTVLRKECDKLLGETGGVTLAELSRPLELTGDAERDVERLHLRVDAHGAMLRAVALKHEAELVGGAAIGMIVVKSLVPLVTTVIKVRKLLGI